MSCAVSEAFPAEVRSRELTELFYERVAHNGTLDEPDDTSPDAMKLFAECMSEPGIPTDQRAGRWLFLEMWRRYMADKRSRASAN